MLARLRARFARWCYLISYGLWRGECTIDVTDRKGILTIASGCQLNKPDKWKIFWTRGT